MTGNVRELQNRVRRAVIMGGKKVTAEDLELTVGRGGTNGSGLREARENLERDLIRQSLRKHGGKISAAATDLGISRPTLYEMMEKLGIQRPE
jgi:two-component system, NtrC family, response regulator